MRTEPLIWLLFAAPAWAANVQGIALNSVTGAPIPRARIMLQGESRYGTTAGADGTFNLTSIPAGTYTLTAQRTGFSMPEPAKLTLTADETRSDIQLKIVPGGAISGRVTDSDGHPVEDAVVSVEGIASDQTLTDENGTFRIGGLPPGKYRVKAGKTNPWDGPPEIRTDGTAENHNAATYFPARVEVLPAGESAGIGIQLARVPFVRVSGKVTGLPRKADEAFVFANQGQFSDGFALNRDGTFELWRLDPGDYRIEAQWNAANGDEIHTNGVEIHVAGSNIDNLELHAVPDSTIAGRIELAGDPEKAIFDATREKPAIQLTMLGAAGEVSSSRIADDASFKLEKLQAGRYWVELDDERLYVKSMRLGTQAIVGPVLDLNEGSHGADLSLLLAAATGSVSGTAPAGEMVLLISADKDTGFDQRAATVAPDGSYTIDHLPPGNYRIAVVRGNTFKLHNNGIVDYDDVMVPVTVGDGEKVTRDLKPL
jgi:hypothetical protein